MIRRRRFLQLAPATLTGALVSNWASAVGSIGRTAMLSRGIFDERFSESRMFSNVLAENGVQMTAIRGDVAKLWYDDLRPALRKLPAPFAGLTDQTTLFCLEELARDVSMRVTTRIDHRSDESFGQLTAMLILQRDTHHRSNPEAQKRSGPSTSNALVSWVIA